MQKTAYELRISDWCSDVCSSDLLGRVRQQAIGWSVGRDRGIEARTGEADQLDVGRSELRRLVSVRRGIASSRHGPRGLDRKSVVSGKRVSGRGELSGTMII